jgi:hypothetical protein
MCVWRCRIDLEGEPPETAVLAASLEDCSARLLSISVERRHDTVTGELMVDLPHDEGVGAILSALHGISPRVLIGRAEVCEGSLAVSR